MQRIFAIVIAAATGVAALAANAQESAVNPVGEWNGVLEVPGQTIRIAVRIEETADGALAGVTGSPDTGNWNVALENVAFAGEALSFDIPTSSGRFEGAWDSEQSAWVGDYDVSGNTFPLTFNQGPLALPSVEGIDGRWEGTLDVQGVELRLVFRVYTNEYGTYALMDSPDQLANGIPVSAVSREGDTVSFEIAVAAGGYEGTLDEAGAALSGTWSQSGMSFPLDLTHSVIEAAAPNRPQTPQEPFPYSIEEVSIDNPSDEEITLACTLTVPETGGPHPAAILITGSGAQDRDESLLGHKPFWVLADHLSRNGIAVLRCDDRGYGESTGTFSGATPREFATDIEAAFNHLRGRPEIDPDRVGLIGHSEGGVTGPTVAARNPEVAFVVMMAGPGVPGDELIVAQGVEIPRAMGAPEEQLEQGRALSRAVIDAVLAAPDEDSAKAAAREVLLELGAAQGMTEDIATAQAERMGSTYMRALLSHDPAPILSEVTAPVLAINGNKDTQVPAWQNLPALRELLADHPDATIVELEGLNHLFQTAETGAPGEYADIEETFAPIALETISGWIAERMLTED